MCAVLDIPTNTYCSYVDPSGKQAEKAAEGMLSKEIARIFKDSRINYGTRKIKKELEELPAAKQVSHCRIGRLMNEMGLGNTKIC